MGVVAIGVTRLKGLPDYNPEDSAYPMIKRILTSALVAIAINVAAMPEARSQDWNYFGACYSDDIVLAQNGKFYTPCMSRGGCTRSWEYGGTYRTLTDGVIEIFWKDENGNRQSSTYTHRRLSKVKCAR